MMKQIRKLNKNEVYARIVSVNRGGAKVLLYKKAGTDQKILDEIFGVGEWGLTYRHTSARMFDKDVIISDATLMIPTDHGFVPITGSSDTIKAEMAGSVKDVSAIDNDAVKRAGFLLGIGEELKTKEMFIPASELFTYSSEQDAATGEWKCGCHDILNIYDLDVTDEKKIESVTFSIRSDYRGTNERLYAVGKRAVHPAPASDREDGKEAPAPAEAKVVASVPQEKETREEPEHTEAPVSAPAETEAEKSAPAPALSYSDVIAFSAFKGQTYGEARQSGKFVPFLKWLAEQNGTRMTDKSKVHQFEVFSKLGALLNSGKSLDEAEAEIGVVSGSAA